MSVNSKDDNIDMQDGDGEEGIYEVESIIDKKKFGTKWKYRVKWVGYSDEETTWEPVENLENVKEMLEQFEEEFKNKTGEGMKKSKIITKPKEKEPSTKNEQKKCLSEIITLEEGKKDTLLKKKKAPEEVKKSLINSLSYDVKKDRFKTSKNGKLQSPAKKSEKSEKITNYLPIPSNSKKTTSISSEDPIILANDDEFQDKFLGSFEANDVPKHLITARQLGVESEVHCLVDWNVRQNGMKPAESFVSNKILREKCPLLLLDFYESRLRFPTQNK